ncbi:unnamed protein product [Prorocentrum cordatum]|uniref:Uncharacterized protein n=1 Tax=Prorocentrum cordatum TaxID=2364126 RepID=A0ABN9T298_9DINO|nr:unnamed protein product [Polarella glacialis]
MAVAGVAKPGLHVGQKVLLLYGDEPNLWHEASILRKSSETCYRRIHGEDPSVNSWLWWILTVDGDVYPQDLSVPGDLQALRLLDAGGEVTGTMYGRGPDVVSRYGFGAGRREGPLDVPLFLRAKAVTDEEERKEGGHGDALVSKSPPPAASGKIWRIAFSSDQYFSRGAEYPSGVEGHQFTLVKQGDNDAMMVVTPEGGPAVLLRHRRLDRRGRRHLDPPSGVAEQRPPPSLCGGRRPDAASRLRRLPSRGGGFNSLQRVRFFIRHG